MHLVYLSASPNSLMRDAKEFVPQGGGDGEWGNDDGARAISTGLGDEGVEEGGRGGRRRGALC